jgi:hypothetical protein
LGVRWRCLLLKKRFTVGVGLVLAHVVLPAKSETNKNPTDSTILLLHTPKATLLS